ncbi:MAG TPA: peptide chain release factor N(5)-glutamine methyltransferase [Bacteroidales bacterium]|jgi:release factor glutamine methyltransferase|nr:peptide chain release factor N(5)-glutamine methyltransferase [Bacteroidales bacterium]
MNTMTNRELERHLFDSIKPVYGEREARAIQRFLFRALHGLSDAEWLLIRNDEANSEFESTVKQAIPSLIQQMPVQYVAGKTWFCNLGFVVKPGVLIPRPETEALVTRIAEKFMDTSGLRVLDIGTGSGAIAVSLSVLLNRPEITAFDISDAALEIASANAEMHNRNVRFYKVDILDKKTWPEGGLYDLIVSNPPYVKESEKAFMQPNVLKYEPGLALFVDDHDALKFYSAIAEFAGINLKPGGSLWFEINEAEGDNIRQLLTEMRFSHVDILTDLSGEQRFASAIRPD